MAYMVFKLVEAKLELPDEKKIKLEQVFSTARWLHNYYVSKYQNLTDEEVRRKAETNPIFPLDVLAQYNAEVMQFVKPLDRNTYGSMIQIITNTWREFAEGKRPRPMFKMPAHIQAFWILDTFNVTSCKWSITIPGPEAVELFVPDGTFSGTPSAIKVSRDKEGDYYIAGLYEQPSKTPLDDSLMTITGLRLNTAITNYHRAKASMRRNAATKNECDQRRMEISIARMTAIAILLKRNKQARKEAEHEALPTETV